MEDTRSIFDGKQPFCRCHFDLIDESNIAPGKKAILSQSVWGIPAKLLNVIKRSAILKCNLAHRFAQIEQTDERLLGFEQVIISLLARGIVCACSDKWILGVCDRKASFTKLKPGSLRISMMSCVVTYRFDNFTGTYPAC